MSTCVWTIEVSGRPLSIDRADGILSQAIRYMFSQLSVEFELMAEYGINEKIEGNSYWTFALKGELDSLRNANEYLAGMLSDIRRHIDVRVEASVNSEFKSVIPPEYT